MFQPNEFEFLMKRRYLSLRLCLKMKRRTGSYWGEGVKLPGLAPVIISGLDNKNRMRNEMNRPPGGLVECSIRFLVTFRAKYLANYSICIKLTVAIKCETNCKRMWQDDAMKSDDLTEWWACALFGASQHLPNSVKKIRLVGTWPHLAGLSLVAHGRKETSYWCDQCQVGPRPWEWDTRNDGAGIRLAADASLSDQSTDVFITFSWLKEDLRCLWPFYIYI